MRKERKCVISKLLMTMMIIVMVMIMMMMMVMIMRMIMMMMMRRRRRRRRRRRGRRRRHRGMGGGERGEEGRIGEIRWGTRWRIMIPKMAMSIYKNRTSLSKRVG